MSEVNIIRKYEINGMVYTFEHVKIREGYFTGFCKKRGKWAYLFDKYLQFKGEPPVNAKRIK